MKNIDIPVRTPVAIAIGIAIGVVTTILIEMLSEQEEKSKTSICMDYSASPFDGVVLDSVLDDIGRYGGTHVPAIEASMAAAGINKPASRSCTFPLDTLKKFIYYLEKYSARHRMNTDTLAVKFYYGVYPQTMTAPNGMEYGSLHTLFLVPTFYKEETNEYIDYDPLTGRLLSTLDNTSIAMVLGVPELRRFYAVLPKLPSNSQQQPMVKNQGGLCPPNNCDSELLSRTTSY